MWSARVSGEQYVAQSERRRSAFASAIRVALSTSAALVESAAKAQAPIAKDGGGALRRSIKAGAATGSRVQVRAGVPYARFMESGTRRHEIRPRVAKRLRFQMNGRMVFARKVMHPGTKALHFMRDAQLLGLARLQASVASVITQLFAR